MSCANEVLVTDRCLFCELARLRAENEELRRERQEKKPLLLETGARISSVDEEGDVRLFLYSLSQSIDIRGGYSMTTRDIAAKRWAARIGERVTLRLTAEQCTEPSAEVAFVAPGRANPAAPPSRGTIAMRGRVGPGAR